MELGVLLRSLAKKKVIGDSALQVKGIAYHSQKVQEGFLFAAIPGTREEGRKYIPDALARGAHSVLVNEAVDFPGVVQVVVPDVREALARLSAAFYQDPSAHLILIGITGTNGKTTTSYLIESVIQAGEGKVGVMGTINYRYADVVFPASTTTPESLDLQKGLAAMREAGVTHAVLEVSSHALSMQRVRGCHFDVALFTNLSRDHLDYHGTLENYFQAKRLLFTQGLGESRKENRFAVINMDDPQAEELARSAPGTVLGYGIQKRAEVWPKDFTEGPEGLSAWIRTPRGSLEVRSCLVGLHNLYNILGAVTAAEALGMHPAAISAGIANLRRVPGRLEAVPSSSGIGVFVDYAHTPDALERALFALQRIRTGRLFVVFGCGGDRDRGKRPLMGRVAGFGSDWAVITSDNPRTEDPLAIIAEVEQGITTTAMKKYSPGDLGRDSKTPGYWVVPDRREAIRLAIGSAKPGDIVLIAGKGHEDYQILGNRKIHFDDREEAAAALADCGWQYGTAGG